MKIIADDKIPYLKGVLEPFADIVYLPGKQITNETAADADALLIRTRTKCNAALLQGTKVRFIATATIGYDHIDTGWCEQNGITWVNAPGCNSSSVQQYIAAAILHLALNYSFNLYNKTLGIIGVGNVGSKVAKLGQALGMKVLQNDPPRQRKEKSDYFISLDRLLEQSDIITLHVPLITKGTDKTYHLADNNFFDKMKPSSFFINSSRGEVTDTTALKEALKTKKLTAAIVDVWENEPDIDTELLKMVEIGTPHIAGYSNDGKANGTAMSVQQLSRFFHLPLNTWYPTTIEKPAFPELILNCTGRSFEDVIYQAILASYDINSDNNRLRSSVNTFEYQRGNYPLRREFPFYTIKINGDHSDIGKTLSAIGFKVTGLTPTAPE